MKGASRRTGRMGLGGEETNKPGKAHLETNANGRRLRDRHMRGGKTGEKLSPRQCGHGQGRRKKNGGKKHIGEMGYKKGRDSAEGQEVTLAGRRELAGCSGKKQKMPGKEQRRKGWVNNGKRTRETIIK